MKSIIVANLTKKYTISQGFLKKQKQFLYALNEVSFEVNQGEIFGIIGKNGSGKSTLLKILSKITLPTSGSAILQGKVASLLEVGTGFHEDLTGKENVFMNGIILGMKRHEIYKHFDEIVQFAGVEQFINMPVKKYSSGMRLRLAFSVAAHLRSDILLVDEVLAVGDYEFEKKCIGLMNSMQTSGRTILFVSHNFAVIRRLCKESMLLSQGGLVALGATEQVISKYIGGKRKGVGAVCWDYNNAPRDEYIVINKVSLYDSNGVIKDQFSADEEIVIEVNYSVLQEQEPLGIMLWFYNDEGVLLFSSLDTSNANWLYRIRKPGSYISICKIPSFIFKPGMIFISLYVTTVILGWKFGIDEIINFLVTPPFEYTRIIGDWGWAWPNVAVQPLIEWNISYNGDFT